MLYKIVLTTVSTAFIVLGAVANAHDPALHKKENAEKPNCESMQNMDHSTMDMNDPVMQAMIKQCISDKGHGEIHRENHQGMKSEKMEETHGSKNKKGGHHN